MVFSHAVYTEIYIYIYIYNSKQNYKLTLEIGVPFLHQNLSLGEIVEKPRPGSSLLVPTNSAENETHNHTFSVPPSPSQLSQCNTIQYKITFLSDG